MLCHDMTSYMFKMYPDMVSCCVEFVQKLTNACIFGDPVNPLAGRATFLSPTVHGRSDNIVVFP